MENNKGRQVSDYALEFVSTRFDRINKRLTIMLAVAMILLFVSNALWLWAWMQYDYESEVTTTETVTVDGKDGVANYANHGGSVVNGAGEKYDYHNQAEEADEEE